MPLRDGETEPMMNIVAWREGRQYISVVIPREKHRPDCYSGEGEKRLLVSPGALDMSGLLIVPREEDFNKLTETQAETILKECGVTEKTMQAVVERIKENLNLWSFKIDVQDMQRLESMPPAGWSGEHPDRERVYFT